MYEGVQYEVVRNLRTRDGLRRALKLIGDRLERIAILIRLYNAAALEWGEITVSCARSSWSRTFNGWSHVVMLSGRRGVKYDYAKRVE
jgi:hypothetical protein